jgi:hypothetical protein
LTNQKQDIVGRSGFGLRATLSRVFLLFSALLAFCEVGAAAQQSSVKATATGTELSAARKVQTAAEDVLTNAQVIELTKLGLSEATIIEKIRHSEHQFDTSVEALRRLKEAQVSDTVIREMINLQGSSQSSIPVIMTVTALHSQARQSIKILGAGFGVHPAYEGDSPYLVIHDVTRGWTAGWSRSNPPSLVTLSVISWKDNEIRLNGFTGDYGQKGWFLNDEDIVDVVVWNPNTGAGPAGCRVIVGSSSTKCQ